MIEKLRRSIDRRQSYAVLYRADLSVESEDVSGFPIAQVTSLQVAPGCGAEFKVLLRENLETFRAAGVVFGVYQRQFGPGPVVWQIVERTCAATPSSRVAGPYARSVTSPGGGVPAGRGTRQCRADRPGV